MRASVHNKGAARSPRAGQIEGESGAFAFAALDVEAAAHGEDQRARLIGADAEALLLGRDEGLEQAVADEVGRHAAAAVDRPRWRRRRRFRSSGCSTGLAGWRWRRSRSGRDGRAPVRAPAGSAMATRPASPTTRTGWARRLAAASASSSGRTSTGRGGSDVARRAGREAGEQVVHLLHRALQGGDHVGAEFGIVGMALGIAGDEAELAHQILDVVHDEGEAAVELVEALGVGERLLAARLGDIGGGLDAGGAEQVEILPVERGGGTRGWSRMTRPASRPPWISGMPAQASSSAGEPERHRRAASRPRPASRRGPRRSR